MSEGFVPPNGERRARGSVARLKIAGPIATRDLPGLSARVWAELERTGAKLALCDVTAVVADAAAVDTLARLALAACRRGCRVRLTAAPGDLRDLVEFMGLGDVLLAE